MVEIHGNSVLITENGTLLKLKYIDKMQYYKATKIWTADISTNIDASQEYSVKQTKPVTKQYR